MIELVLDEKVLQLVVKTMGWKYSTRHEHYNCRCGIWILWPEEFIRRCDQSETFAPHRNQSDLVQFMEAMRLDGWMLGMASGNLGYRACATRVNPPPFIDGRSDWCKTFIEAMFWACIEGLEAK